MPTSTDRLAVLRDQLDLTWRLAEVVLEDVTDEEYLWLPSERSWTVHRDDTGRWVPDWQEPEPPDVAQPSLAWTMWQTRTPWTSAAQRVLRSAITAGSTGWGASGGPSSHRPAVVFGRAERGR